MIKQCSINYNLFGGYGAQLALEKMLLVQFEVEILCQCFYVYIATICVVYMHHNNCNVFLYHVIFLYIVSQKTEFFIVIAHMICCYDPLILIVVAHTIHCHWHLLCFSNRSFSSVEIYYVSLDCHNIQQ